MDSAHERDQSIERLLRDQRLAPEEAAGSDACLDPERLSAWIEGSLSGAALEQTQLHVADCARCQAVMGALARFEPPPVEPVREPAMRRWLTWLVPLTAAATAVALWVAVPHDARPPASSVPMSDSQTTERAGTTDRPGVAREAAPAAPTTSNQPTAPAQAQPESGSLAEAPGEPPAKTGSAPAVADAAPDRRRADAETREEKAGAPPAAAKQETFAAGSANQEQQSDRAAMPAPAAPPPATPAAPAGRLAANAALAQEAFAPLDVVSPQPSIRWRIRGSTVHHSADAGNSWETLATGSTGALTAGSSPAATICWLVGRGGLVLLTVDGRNFRPVAFPVAVDLAAVRAVSATEATVTTGDGRTFGTRDGGMSWTGRN